MLYKDSIGFPSLEEFIPVQNMEFLLIDCVDRMRSWRWKSVI